MKDIICTMLDISEVSYYRWKKDRKIIPFLEQYFNKKDLEEYISLGRVDRLELIKNYTTEELQNKLQNNPNNSDNCHYHNFAFKCRSLSRFPKLLLIIILQNNTIASKEELLNCITDYTYTKRQIRFLKKLVLLKFDEIEYSTPNNADRDVLHRFVSNYICNEEIIAFSKNQDFDILA